MISLGSLTCPIMADAATVSGLARNVLDPGHCLPSKFLLDVEIQYFPAGILSSFIPKHALHHAPLHSAPASIKIRSNHSFCACFATCADHGTTRMVT